MVKNNLASVVPVLDSSSMNVFSNVNVSWAAGIAWWVVAEDAA